MTPDVNVLVAASRSDHPHHATALAWLEQALSEAGRGALLKVQPMVVASFLRLVTHPKIFVQPTPIADALGFVAALLTMPGVVQPELGGEWPVLNRLCTDKALAANDIPDAWLAAATIHQGEHLVSFDADFKRLLPRERFTHLMPSPS
ncbi:MAG: PIN domain-containing protein [Betaproteobacteria bacterium]|nr:PIN domain-containing protein [Betaproteobacteria bacterium]MCL2886352.1 PIN domain-containing protein [Betaproteobacteria bacterium]